MPNKVPVAVLITAVAVATLQQVGAEVFKSSAGAIGKSSTRSPEQILSERARDDSQGLLSLFRPDKVFTITFDETDSSAKGHGVTSLPWILPLQK